MDPFYPHRGPDPETRFRTIENYLMDNMGAGPYSPNAAVAAGVQPASNEGRSAIPQPSPGIGSPPKTETQIPEQNVTFDPTDGHFHDGVDSTPTIMTGDVTGTNTVSVVAKINGQTAPAPGASDDKHFLRYDNGGAQYVLVAVPVLTMLGAWLKADCSTLTGADVELPNTFGSAAIANPMLRAGTLVGLTVRTTADFGAGTESLIVTVYKNGVATALTATFTGTAGTDQGGIAEVSPVAFAAGDVVTVQAHKAGTPAAVGMVVTVWGTLN